jgi:hypothetical protein
VQESQLEQLRTKRADIVQRCSLEEIRLPLRSAADASRRKRGRKTAGSGSDSDADPMDACVCGAALYSAA